ncbi:MAG: glycosyltransferase family protein [Hyphomicrobiales bacterium]|nr:glycosyltransferase family protein [Hyphomicrobiales bacterium]MCP5373346.1 glycosyltransferase family protein [Hyphomicrobiales bacterium]
MAAAEDRRTTVARLMDAARRDLAEGGPARALETYARVLALEPDNADALSNTGVCLRRLGRHGAAVAAYHRALATHPGAPAVWSNLGNAYRDLGRLDEAEAALNRARDLSGGAVDTVFNLALVLKDKGRFDDSLALLDAVLARHPDHVGAAWDRALLLLETGDLKRGFDAYETRWKRADARRLSLDSPPWDGTDLGDGTLLVVREQGFGDMIQFARFAAQARQRCGRLVVECQPEMLRLMATVPGVDAVASEHEPPPPHDAHVPMLGLPRLLGTDLDSIPAQVPYLRPPRPAKPAPHSLPRDRFRVGIAWAGKPTHRNDRNRSCPPQRFLDLMEVPGAVFACLQKGPAAADLTGQVPAALLPDLAAACDDFADTAAVMQNLDLVVTVDTAVAHLAGALGRPVWVLLPHVPDWRWMRGRDDSPWYPTMRLFRQDRPGDWEGVFRRARAALSQAVSDSRARAAGAR